MSISAFFRDTLQAKFVNHVWGWGAVRQADEVVFLRVWADESEPKQDPKRVYVLNLHPNHPRSLGEEERLRHVKRLRAGAKGFGVVCFRDTKPGEKASIKTYDDEELLEFGGVFEESGKVYARVIRKVKVEQAAVRKGGNASLGTRSATAAVARSIQSGHPAPYVERAKRAIPVLIERALLGMTVRYQELANELGVERGRNMNYVLGCVGSSLDELAEKLDEDIPLLQSLVVNQTGRPGIGFESGGRVAAKFASKRGSTEEKFEALWEETTSYERWPLVLRGLGLPPNAALQVLESKVELEQRTDVGPAEKQRLRWERIGQGQFRWAVARIEKRCRVTKISQQVHLRASHIKPWAKSSDAEKRDGYNGLLLAPHIDHLFDKGYISFADDGRLLVAKGCDSAVLKAWKVKAGLRTGNFHAKQQQFLDYHRRNVFLKE